MVGVVCGYTFAMRKLFGDMTENKTIKSLIQPQAPLQKLQRGLSFFLNNAIQFL
jgi:hypothetical protein